MPTDDGRLEEGVGVRTAAAVAPVLPTSEWRWAGASRAAPGAKERFRSRVADSAGCPPRSPRRLQTAIIRLFTYSFTQPNSYVEQVVDGDLLTAAEFRRRQRRDRNRFVPHLTLSTFHRPLGELGNFRFALDETSATLGGRIDDVLKLIDHSKATGIITRQKEWGSRTCCINASTRFTRFVL